MLRPRKVEECRELCERRALLEKILVNRSLDVEKCIKVCRSVLFFYGVRDGIHER
jgi:hypothetical protein